jgi:hypothetical protein
MHGPNIGNKRSCNSLLTMNGWVGGSSGALRRDVNAQCDKNGISYARKTMNWCGMSLGLDGAWPV